jgi:hypothetical protein
VFIPTHCYNVMRLYLSGLFFLHIHQQICMVLNIEKSTCRKSQPVGKVKKLEKIEAFLQNL